MIYISTYTEIKTQTQPSKMIFKGIPNLPEAQLVNKVQLRDAKLKDFLVELIDKNIPLSLPEISEQFGSKNSSAIKKRIYANPEIKELWEKVLQLASQKTLEINNKIKIILESAIKEQTPIAAKDVAKMSGVSYASCRQRIRLNPELKKLFAMRNEKPKNVKTSEAIDLEDKIKQILENAIKNNEYVSAKQIAEELGLKRHQVQGRIRRNSVLKSLWDKFEHYKIPKKSQKAKDDDINIRNVLTKALRIGKYLTAADVASLTGLSLNACLHRFSKNQELKEIWQKVSKTTNSNQDNFEKIKMALLRAIKTKEYTTLGDIGKLIGMKLNSVSSRFAYSPELKGLWMKVQENNRKCANHSLRIKEARSKNKDKMIPEESKEVNELLKLIIETAIANKTPLDRKTVAKQLGISVSDVSRRANLPEIRTLWEQCKQIAITLENEKVDSIAKFFENAINTQQALTIADAAKAFNMKDSVFIRFIYKTPRLTELWNKIEHKGGKFKNLKTADENKQIIEIMQNAIRENTPLLLEDIATIVGTTVPAIKGKFSKYPQIKEIWDNVPRKKIYIETKESAEKIEKIKKALEKRIAQNQPFMLLEIAKDVKMDIPALYLKVRRTSILAELWQSAEKKFVTDDSFKINRKIRNVLLDALDKEEYLNNSEIAQRAGVSYDTCTKRIQKDEDLNKLVEQVRKIRINNIEQENNLLQQVFENAIDTNTIISINTITEMTGISGSTFDYKIANSKKLKQLWTKVKKINVNILKEINRLSTKQMLSNAEIKQKLNLNDDKFQELIFKYEKIKSILTKYTNPLIKDDDILNWAVLSKREFELAVCEIFKKMGYNSKTTTYTHDKGIDVIAEKDGKITCIECMHNLYRAIEPEELLALQGNKYYFDADNVIYASISGVTSFGQKLTDKLGDSFKVFELADLILLAKKYKVNINNLKEKGDIELQNSSIYGGRWKFVSGKKPEDVFEWRKLRQEEFDKRIKDIFISKDYTVVNADELNLSGYYVVSKNNKKTIIKCHNSNNIPTLDEVKSLYGLKDFYDAEDVILIGPASISVSAKDYIDKINSNQEATNTYKLLSIDKLIDLYDTSKK